MEDAVLNRARGARGSEGALSIIEQYRRWRAMAEAALRTEVVNAEPLEVEGLALTGMGGSGIVGDFVSALMEGS